MKRILFVLLIFLLIKPFYVYSQAKSPAIPSVSIDIKGDNANKGSVASTIKILLLFTLLTLSPAILMTATSFTRIIISFHFLRQAMGIQGVPPNQVLIGLSLFMTLFIMSPVGMKINKVAVEPYNQGKLSEIEALKKSTEPLKDYMLTQTREKDLALFYNLSKEQKPKSTKDVKMLVLFPAYILSEMKTAFQIGFLLYIPFIIIDTVVAAILVSMGMMFLPPMMVSMPFKLILFIMADGWTLLISSLVKSFNLGGF